MRTSGLCLGAEKKEGRRGPWRPSNSNGPGAAEIARGSGAGRCAGAGVGLSDVLQRQLDLVNPHV
jgi:hypothetical protein